MRWREVKRYEKMRQYAAEMRPVFKSRAVFSDETEAYRTPCTIQAGQTMQVRIRTWRNNVDEIFLVAGEKRIPMRLLETEGGFDYYGAEVACTEEPVSYYFELNTAGLTCVYTKNGCTDEADPRYFFRITPGFSVPEWTKGAVMYQIFPDRFRNGDPSNDVLPREYSYLNGYVERVTDWSKLPSSMDMRNFYGGDLAGILEKLDYLHDLGVEVLYLNPIFVSPSNHKYDIQDYDHVDPHLTRIVKESGFTLAWGELENREASRYISRVTDPENLEAADAYFAYFMQEVHKRGMKVILDGVFNHCGSFNKWMDRERIYEGQKGYKKGAFVDEKSPYHNFFRFTNEDAWPYNEFYDGWWGHNTLPKLNYEESPELVEYILRIAKKWVSPPYSADGWRLDVAADLGYTQEYNHTFWKMFRKAVKEANPDAVILAEHYGECSDWLKGDEWDTVMNYDAFMEPVSFFLTGMEKHSDSFHPELLGDGLAFQQTMTHNLACFQGESAMCAMNELDNHDHSRFLTRTNHYVGRVNYLGSEAASENINPAVMREAVVIQMTFVGAPTIYYGDEAGVPGFTDPDNRRTYPWGHEDREMLDFYKKAVKLHSSYPVFRTGSIKPIGCGEHYISYGRFSRDQQIVIAVNSGPESRVIEIPVWEIGIPRDEKVEMRRLLSTWRDGYSDSRQVLFAVGGMLTMNLRPYEAVVFGRNV